MRKSTSTPSRENLFTASYREELTAFTSAVRGDGRLTLPAEHVTLLRLVEAAYASAERQAEVRL